MMMTMTRAANETAKTKTFGVPQNYTKLSDRMVDDLLKRYEEKTLALMSASK
jgi:hypothetical protein